MVPETQNLKTLALQKLCTFLIIFCLLQVLTSIKLNHQSFFQADKICNVIGDFMLPTEFAVFDLAIT